MSQDNKQLDNPARRGFVVSWTTRIAAGVAIANIPGCGGGSGDGGNATKTADTLPEPGVIASKDGSLSIDLVAQYARQDLVVAAPQAIFPGEKKTVATQLRSFNGRYLAPTLKLQPGDTLRVQLRNNLPANATGESSLRHLNYQNSTNLHFPGAHHQRWLVGAVQQEGRRGAADRVVKGVRLASVV
jgi:FtsP/CotA-like multicopper oxidase with cupredoxin domain